MGIAAKKRGKDQNKNSQHWVALSHSLRKLSPCFRMSKAKLAERSQTRRCCMICSTLVLQSCRAMIRVPRSLSLLFISSRCILDM